MSGTRGVEGSWMYKCAAASLVFGKRGRVAIFLCLEVLGQIAEMPTVKLKV